MAADSIRLKASDLSKRYGPRWLFRRLSLVIAGGESLAITGPNGSGKSTLLKILGGLLVPTHGEIELQVNGRAVPATEHALQVGIVAPYANLYLPLTAEENLLFLARLRGTPDRHDRVRNLLREVGLNGRARDPVATYSSGMMQRLRLAAALLAEPPLLLLDEPSVTLDAAGNELVARIIRDQVTRERIVVVATNLASEAERCARQLDLLTDC